MAILVGMDKAGPSPEIPAVTTAGVIVEERRLGEFREHWSNALDEFDGQTAFYTSEYESGKGPYRDWQDRGVKKERLTRLLSLIEEHALGVVAVTVSLEHCRSFYSDKPVIAGLGITATHCFMLVPQFRYVADRAGLGVAYTFEAGEEGLGKLLQQYDAMRANPLRRWYNRIDGEMEVERRSHPLLQAADVLAYECWKQWARDSAEETRAPHHPFARLAAAVPIERATLRPIRLADALLPGIDSPFVAPLVGALGGPHAEMLTAPLPEGVWG